MLRVFLVGPITRDNLVLSLIPRIGAEGWNVQLFESMIRASSQTCGARELTDALHWHVQH